MPLSREEFVRRWKISSQTESQGSQTHFNDLCELLSVPRPGEEPDSLDTYTFEKPVGKVYGGTGFADVWKRGYFAWEYKGKRKDLKAAYKQINDYREDLGNPPLLVVCDMDRFEIHTNFTNTKSRTYSFDLDDLKKNVVTPSCPLPPFDVLRALFTDFNVLRPNRTDAYVTQEAAKTFARLAERLEIEKRALTDTPIHTREEIAHFLMRLLFCLFADNIELLPKHCFRNLIRSDDRFTPRIFLRKLRLLFEAMSEPDGIFGEHTIKYFNGGLFDSATIITLDVADLGILHEAASKYNWSHVAPEIFGTLFERSLNAERRSLIGAHYTSAEDILLLVEPVVMDPLRRRWEHVRASVLVTLGEEAPADPAETVSRRPQLNYPTRTQAETQLAAWFDELAAVRVLDPACGSGNFLYVTLRRLLDLWNEARVFAIDHNLPLATQYAIEKMVSPQQLFGIEIEFYAHELASIVVWIGYIQWKRENSIIDDPSPILKKLDNIQHADAILRYDEDGKPYEPEWPAADFIVGNPPFLGDKRMRSELGGRFVEDVRRLYDGRVPGGADLVTYWFEKAREAIDARRTKRAGMLATNSIRMVGNRPVLDRVLASGSIFMAWSDRPWLLDGASVRISIIGFDDGSQEERTLDGRVVLKIHANLTGQSNTGSALSLRENENLCFLGIMKGGPFDLDVSTAEKMLAQPLNPNGRPNSDVVRRRLSGQDITGRDRGGWVINFLDMNESQASLYEWPFEYLKVHVKPFRDANRDASMKRAWWRHGRTRPALREASKHLTRRIVTPEVAKFRIFVWSSGDIDVDHSCHVITREDDYFFGLLQSGPHEAWSLSVGSTLENRPRYTSDSTFKTFPFPYPPGTEPSEAESPIVRAIADAARTLVDLRDRWLNPPGASEADLKARTLTNLYNKRPAWLDDAHRRLDEAVFAAYGWPADLPTQEILARLLALNHQRAAAQASNPPSRNSPSQQPRVSQGRPT